MTRDDIISMAREAGMLDLSEPGEGNDLLLGEIERFAALVAAAEREACIAAIQAQIYHAHINELRLVPRFGKRLGEIAVRADDLEAMLDGIRTRGQQ